MKTGPRIFLVVGPTASGKTEFAQKLAVEQGGEILNADSQQFYRGLDIGTGKCPPSERQVLHWLLDLCEPGQFMTAGNFARIADETISVLGSRGTQPFVVGGTGLYVRALLEGLDELPERNSEIRQKLEAECQDEGSSALHRRLQEIDPASAAKIHPNDPSRLIRFLEIFLLTGKPPSQILQRGRPTQLRYPVTSFWLRPPREELRGKIEKRVRAMVAQGWLEETRASLNLAGGPEAWPNQPIGYLELSQVLSGQLPLEEAIQKIVRKTQQYAKRQETFWRGLFQHPAYQNDGNELKIV